MKYKENFWQALKDLFIGAEVEGKSGYINLMRIKSKYFEKHILPQLEKDINEVIETFPDFENELYEKLYTFFKSYFSESGAIYFNSTPYHKSIYERVYTDDKDVILFWKTRMLYYVKTDRIFRSLKVEIDEFKFFFDVSTLEHKKANEKRELIYEFKKIQEDGTIVFNVFYTERGKKTNGEKIIKELRKQGIKITTDTLERAFKIFEKQSEVDYFINKNAKSFLKEQFDLWLYQYVFKEKSDWTEKRIKELQALKDIAYKIIDFISQFEDELVKIWNKPKFVFNSNYVITLDRIAERNIDVIEKILNHPNFEEQLREWKELGFIDKNFDKEKIIEHTLHGKILNEKYKFLPIDTKYFKDLEVEIISLFDNLDESLDGWLIKSENYQALNTILPKFREKIQTIYIDPPFNKEQDADYFYSVKYKDATWITMLENRLKIARDLLKDTGSIFVRCDYNGNMYVRLLMNEIFGEENFRNEIQVNRTKKIFTGVKGYNVATDNLFFYSKNEKFYFNPQYKQREKKQKWLNMHSPGERKPPERIIFGKLFYPPKGRHWTFVQEKIYELEKQGRIRINENIEYIDIMGNKVRGMPQYLTGETELLDSNWTDIPGYSQTQGFPTENSEILLKRVIESTSNENDLIMDFFLGSGTTCAVAHKLKRKWIGIEVGEHFYTVVLPRMKKVLFYDKSGISKEKDVKEKYNEKNAGGFFKYYELEQYEDVLKKAKYSEDANLFENPYEDPYNQYVFMKDEKMLSCLEINYEKNKVKVNLSKLYSKEKDKKEIDIVETLSNLTGKWIKKITKDYAEFEDGMKIDLKNLEYIELPDGRKEMFYKYIKDLIWW
ncbi:site-specific DNA-methyltransferase [Thermodesulfobacterium hydrogeniphilum]|uniref:site-specific DNA-methyltransferase n=1 Tax=Thermodesulfobacterium hydrogeniphilum TaxID=161156 RepID=UPI00056EDCF5|nr:site-specific DNA-methyltransferase [Thermodesulfobacterium hydrogeniphilum]